MPNSARTPPETPGPVSAAVRNVDPFDDVEALRLSPDATTVAVRKVITRVPVRKPGNQEFFRVHPSEPIGSTPGSSNSATSGSPI